MVPSIRFTTALLTPGREPAAFSTWAEQAAQVMPVTTNFSFITPPPYFISFCSVVTSSSMTASSP